MAIIIQTDGNLVLQQFSYVNSVLIPEAIIYLVMDFYNIGYIEVILIIFVERPMTGQVTWPVNVEELQQVSCQISLKHYMFTVLLIALTFCVVAACGV